MHFQKTKLKQRKESEVVESNDETDSISEENEPKKD